MRGEKAVSLTQLGTLLKLPSSSQLSANQPNIALKRFLNQNLMQRCGLKWVGVFLAGAIAPLGVGPAAIAQNATYAATTIFEDVTLSPGFSPNPTIVRGISGGAQPATDVAGRPNTETGPCLGFVDDTPDHTMVLTDYFSFLSLQVESTENTTLVVRGPGGSWCNDNYGSFNPAIAGQWFSGTYQIWVGSDSGDRYYPYVLRISDTQPGIPSPGAASPGVTNPGVTSPGATN